LTNGRFSGTFFPWRRFVITTGEITPQSIESIKGSLKGFNLDRLVKFFDGSKVVDLLDENMPEYFFYETPKD